MLNGWTIRKRAQRAHPTLTACERCGSTNRLQRHHPGYSQPELDRRAVPDVPREGGHGGRDTADAPGQDVHRLWHDVYPVQPQPGEVLLNELCERARAAQRAEALGNPWLHEPDIPRVARGVAHRVDRLRCLGNAVVPQVAEWIGRRIIEAAVA